jgi:hypothetical protein
MIRDPLRPARRSMRWAARFLRWWIERLRRREGTLSFHAERNGPFAREAESLAGDLGCVLTDHLGPAADALERAARGWGRGAGPAGAPGGERPGGASK